MEEADSPGRIPLLRRRIPSRSLRTVSMLLILVLVVGSVVVSLTLYTLSRDLPSPARLQSIEPAIKTLIFSAQGDTLREYFRQNRIPVPLAEIPPLLINGILDTEDRDFFEHYGVSVRGFARAAVVNMRSGRAAQGGSTLTMQLARSLFLHHRKEWTRKVREILLALQIERTYTKDEILQMYLNTIYFGPAYGVEAASIAFFGQGVREIGPAELTLLAGVLNNPGYYSPYRHLDRAYQRRGTILSNLVRAGHLSAAEAESIGSTEVEIIARDESNPIAPYFVEQIRQYLELNYGVRALYEEGLRVYTTIESGLQVQAERFLEAQMVRLEEAEEYEFTRALYDSLNADVEAAERPLPQYLQGALVFLDVRTGAVKAMVGGRDFGASKFNRAVQARRQPGSVFKPFLYAAALKNGWTPASVLLDTPVEVETGSDELWRPVNFSGTFEGPMSLRYALANSVNVPAVRVILDLGTHPVLDQAEDLGLDRALIPDVPSIALGAGEVTLIDIVSAYSAFANHGIRARPMYYTRIENARGDILEEVPPYQEEALDEDTNALLVDMMQSALREGTGRGARAWGFNRTGAGKTGTTDQYSDAWFVGFTPDVVGGVWVGFDQVRSMGQRKTGAVMALPIWAQTMALAVSEMPESFFRLPATIVERLVCSASGQLPSPSCPDLATEIFAFDRVPQRTCELHQPPAADIREQAGDFESIDARSSDKEEFEVPDGGGG